VGWQILTRHQAGFRENGVHDEETVNCPWRGTILFATGCNRSFFEQPAARVPDVLSARVLKTMKRAQPQQRSKAVKGL
jgi:hypothetical protein